MISINPLKSCLSFLLFFVALLSQEMTCIETQNNQTILIDKVKRLKKKQNIKLTLLYPEGSLPNIRPVVRIFAKQTGIEISLMEVSLDNINTKMLLSATQKTSDYDIALPATYGLPDLVEAGALYDLTTFAKKYESQVDYQPSLYDLGDTYKGKKYGYQADGDAYVMFYNKNWLEDKNEQQRFYQQYHRALSVPKTWEELDTLMEFFHRPKEGKYGGNLFRIPKYMVWEWWMRFHEAGAYPVNDNMQPNIANKAGVKALEGLIRASQFQSPWARSNGLFANWKEFAKGNSFVNIGWGGSQKYFHKKESKIKDQIIHAPTPGVSYFNWGWDYVVSKYSKHPEIAYLFILFASTSDISTLSVREDGFFDPFREEHYHDPIIEKAYGTSFLDAHKQAITSVIPDFYIEAHWRYIQALQEAIVSALEGYVTPQEALDYAARQWEIITQEVGRESQAAQWKRLKQKYPPSFSQN